MAVTGISLADVGDAVALTFAATSGATVKVSVYDPDGNLVVDDQTVPEDGSNAGSFPFTFTATAEGMWRAVFTASGVTAQVDTFYLRALPVDGPAPLATAGEVQEVFRPLNDAEHTLVRGLLRHASRRVRRRWPDVDTRLASGDLTAGDAAEAVVNMVLRVLRNPAGLRSETVGPFTRAFDPALAAGQLRLTDAEVELLAPVEAAPPPPVGTIRVTPGLAPPKDWRCRRVRRW